MSVLIDAKPTRLKADILDAVAKVEELFEWKPNEDELGEYTQQLENALADSRTLLNRIFSCIKDDPSPDHFVFEVDDVMVREHLESAGALVNDASVRRMMDSIMGNDTLNDILLRETHSYLDIIIFNGGLKK